MLKKSKIVLILIIFIISGCTNSNKTNSEYVRDSEPGAVLISSYGEIEDKIKNEESFIILFDLLDCTSCQDFYKMLSTYLNNHNVRLLEVAIDREFEDSDVAKKELSEFFPDITNSPSIYYVREGVIESEFIYHPDALEERFDEWVQKNKLDEMF